MNNTSIYLIDDEPELLALLVDVLDLMGLEAKSYTRAEHFFVQVKDNDKDAILVLDLHMPDMDGIEVMRRLAKLPASPALILISGQDPGVLSAAEKLGHAHHLNILGSLTKPVDLGKFKQILEQNVIDRKTTPSAEKPPDKYDLSATELSIAIEENQLVLFYQPQIEIITGRTIGVEALVHWNHPTMGLIRPDHFIPLAEKNGLIGDLTHWVIHTAVYQQKIWASFGVTLAVNISAVDITRLTLPEQLEQLLLETKLDPTQIILEVTESALMGELVTSLDILTRLRLKGVGLSIDDFGTGYSSLSQLHRVPFTEMKIDRSFVIDMMSDDEARAIVKTCIMLGHELNMQIVAEGVETEDHLAALKQLGCDVAQGYLFSKPMLVDDMTKWLTKPHIPKVEVNT